MRLLRTDIVPPINVAKKVSDDNNNVTVQPMVRLMAELMERSGFAVVKNDNA